jgi:hypothetical protein
MLENSRHQDAGVAGKYFFGAIAVMHVEIDDRHARQTPRVECVSRRDGDIVEKAEAHRLATLGVMAGRSDRAKGVVRFAAHHQVSGITSRAGRAQGACKVPGDIAVSGIEMDDAMRRTAVMHMVYVVARMNAQQLLHLRQRCIVELEIDVETGGNQAIADRAEPVRALRMMRSHVVLPAVAMGNEGGGCHIECFA